MRPPAKVEPGRVPPNRLRPSLHGGDYICAKDGLEPVQVDPVTGDRGILTGPDCRDVNPDGKCEAYQVSGIDLVFRSVAVLSFTLAILMAALAVWVWAA